MPLSTIVVGCGAVAQRLYRKPLQQLQARGILEINALVDPVAAHADALAVSFPKAIKYADLGEALTRAKPVLTLVLTPAHLHADQTIQALHAGSHVLCEKPMASRAADCERMAATAREAKRLLAIGMIRRFFPAFAQLKQVLAKGRLGSLLSFEYREGHKFEWDVTTPAAFRRRADGGTGVLFDIGPHVVDHLAWTFGELRVLSYADDAQRGVESNMSMQVDSPACPGAIHLSWDSPQANELRVFGSQGEAVLRIDQFDQLALRTSTVFAPQAISIAFAADTQVPPGSRVTPASYTQAVYCQLVQTARAITCGEAPAVDAESGGRCVATLEAALAMARPLDMPWLDAAERNAATDLHWTHL